MRVEESDRGSGDFWAFELLDSGFKTCNMFSHDLCPRLPLSIVVLATVRLLGADTLRAGGLRSVASLQRTRTMVGHGTDGRMGERCVPFCACDIADKPFLEAAWTGESGMRAAALFFDVAPTEVANGVGVVDVVAIVAAAEPVSSTISGGALPS